MVASQFWIISLFLLLSTCSHEYLVWTRKRWKSNRSRCLHLKDWTSDEKFTCILTDSRTPTLILRSWVVAKSRLARSTFVTRRERGDDTNRISPLRYEWTQKKYYIYHRKSFSLAHNEKISFQERETIAVSLHKRRCWLFQCLGVVCWGWTMNLQWEQKGCSKK